MSSEPQFFETPAAFRAWLKKHHATAGELIVGFHKVHAVRAGKASITWPESVAEVLCFGWIDGVRKSLDENTYTIRFTPRRATSKWSAVNVRLMAELEAAGKMTDAGRAVFAKRRDAGSSGYKAQKKDGTLDAARLKEFKKHATAWEYYSSQPPGYQRMAAWWVMHAKREETRDQRLRKLIESSESGKRLK